MRIDSFGCVIMEHSSYEGNLGDSFAETHRRAHLKALLGDYILDVNLKVFYDLLNRPIRHPLLELFVDDKGESWGVTDFSGDQLIAGLFATRKLDSVLYSRLINQTKDNGWRTGNGDLIHPGTLAELYENQTIRVLNLLGQQLIFKLPTRYNDEKQGFEPNSISVCDYLNYIHSAVYTPSWIRKLGPSKEKLLDAIKTYYEAELELEKLKIAETTVSPKGEMIAHELIELYDLVLTKYW